MAKNSNKKVIVGLSGGVDSAVAAYLLQQQGYEVSAVYMQNWEEDSSENCSSVEDLASALAVSEHLSIKIEIINFAKEYWQEVFEQFISAHAAGLTPNPDILCNSEIKFKHFLNYALDNNADFIATGHYAEIVKFDSEYKLKIPMDKNKDQTYFLHKLQQHQLRKSIFPLAAYNKDSIRQIAAKISLPNSTRKDSTGICFIGEKNYKNFLSGYMLAKPGDIVDEFGNIHGRHDGLIFYTIGQRKGIKLGGVKNTLEKPWYVMAKDFSKNQLLICQGDSNKKLFKDRLRATDVHWIGPKEPQLPLQCMAKIRYRQELQDCEIIKNSNGIVVVFAKQQRAITPGQSVVFYLSDYCLGGAIICT